MRVRMIFSTRYCGLVPWMLCASFTVRFAMAAAPQPPSTPRRAAPLPFREVPAAPSASGPPPPSYLRAVTSLSACGFGAPGANMALRPARLLPALPPPPPEWAGLRVGFGAKFYASAGRRSRCRRRAPGSLSRRVSGPRPWVPQGSGRGSGSRRALGPPRCLFAMSEPVAVVARRGGEGVPEVETCLSSSKPTGWGGRGGEWHSWGVGEWRFPEPCGLFPEGKFLFRGKKKKSQNQHKNGA